MDKTTTRNELWQLMDYVLKEKLENEVADSGAGSNVQYEAELDEHDQITEAGESLLHFAEEVDNTGPSHDVYVNISTQIRQIADEMDKEYGNGLQQAFADSWEGVRMSDSLATVYEFFSNQVSPLVESLNKIKQMGVVTLVAEGVKETLRKDTSPPIEMQILQVLACGFIEDKITQNDSAVQIINQD